MIKNSVLEALTILRFKLDRLKERERALVLLSTLSGLLLVWYFLSYAPQSKALYRTQTSVSDMTQSTAKLTQKRTMIEGLVKDNSVSKLLAKYDLLQSKMKELENNFNRYQKRFIDYKQLNSLLYSILQHTTDVSIVTFTNTSTVTTEDAKQLSAPTTPSEGSGQPAQPAQQPAAAPPPQPEGPMVERYQYKLVLKGSYASITDYLTKLEATGWQFYWDKLNYIVETHPEAMVTIEFYTLRPTESEQPSVNGG